MSTSRDLLPEQTEQNPEGFDNEAAKILLRNGTALVATTVATAAWSSVFHIISARAAPGLAPISVFSLPFWATFYPASFKRSVNASATKSVVATGGKNINNHVDEAFANEELTQNQQILMKYRLMSLGVTSAATAFMDVLFTGIFTNPAILHAQGMKDPLSWGLTLKLNRGALEVRYGRSLANSLMMFGFPLVNEQVNRMFGPGLHPLQNPVIAGSLCGFVSSFITNPMSYLIKNVVYKTKFTRNTDGKIIDLTVASTLDIFKQELKTNGIRAFFRLKDIFRVVPQQAGVILLFNLLSQKDLVPNAVYEWVDRQLPAKKQPAVYTANQHQTLFKPQSKQVLEVPAEAAPTPAKGI